MFLYPHTLVIVAALIPWTGHAHIPPALLLADWNQEHYRGEFLCNGGSKSRGDGISLVSPRGIPLWDRLRICFLGFENETTALELLVGLANPQLYFESKLRAVRMTLPDEVFVRATQRLEGSE